MSYILLVEDNQDNADMIIRILTSVGLEVQHTLRGLDGAMMAMKKRPDLILMDYNLPDIDGRTIALLLRDRLGGRAAPPIVAITARANDLELRMAKHFGLSAFISKPFMPEQLLNVVNSLLKRSTTSQPETKQPE